MKIEPGVFQCRNGQIVEVSKQDDPEYPFYSAKGPDGNRCSWRKEGNYLRLKMSMWDLIKRIGD